MTAPRTVAELEREIARLRSIIHRAHAQIMSYNTREGIRILDEINEDDLQPSDAERERFATALYAAISDGAGDSDA